LAVDYHLSPLKRLKGFFWVGRIYLTIWVQAQGYVKDDSGRHHPIHPVDSVPALTSHSSFL